MGGYRSLPFDSHRFLVGGSGHGRRRAEHLRGSGGSGSSSGASRGGESGTAATASGGATQRDAAVERAAGGHVVAGPAAEEAGVCAAAVQVQRARARAYLLM